MDKIKFNDMWTSAMEKAHKQRRYNRKQAYPLLSFRTSKLLTDWLRGHAFMSHDDRPASYVLRKGFMDCTLKYPHGYSSRCHFVPFITESGLQYFKKLLANPEALQRVVAEIAAENKGNSRCIT